MNIWHQAFPAVRECTIPPFQAKFNCNILIFQTFPYEHLVPILSCYCKRVHHSPPFQAKLNPDSIDFVDLSLQTFGTEPFQL